MAGASFLQSSFLGGQWSKFMQGRMDHPKYATAMAVCLNAFPVEEGACVRRPGTMHLGIARNGQPGRVIAFEFVESNPYTMEFTDGYLRLWAGNQIVTGAPLSVASIDGATPGNVTTTSAHGLTSGQTVVFGFAGPPEALANAGLLNQMCVVTVTGATTFSLSNPIPALTFSLSDPTTVVPIHGTNMSMLGVTVAPVLEFATPYTGGTWADLRAVPAQSANQMSECFLLHPSLPPMLLTVTAAPGQGTPFYQFVLTTPTFQDGPYLNPVTSTTVTFGGSPPLGGAQSLTISDPTQINGGQGFLATDVGRLMRVFNEPPVYAAGTTYTNGQSVSYPGQAASQGDSGTSYYTMNDPGNGGQSGNEPDLNPTVWSLAPAVAFWNWGIITAVQSNAEVTLNLQGASDMTYTACTTFAMGAFGPSTGYPTCGTFHEGRLWLGGLFANRFDSSVSNDPLTYSPTVLSGVVLDSSAISEVLNSADQNMIYWMQPDHLGIICGTLAGEWLIQASTLADPLTPTSIQAHRVTKYGCADVLPVRTGISLVFVQKFRRRLLEFLADVFTGKFIAPNLSLTAKNLTAPGVSEIAYQEELAPIIWARCDDGSLIGCTYRRISSFTTEEPAFVGWHEHTFGSGRLVESLTMGPSPDGLLDSPVMVTNDPKTNIRHLETFGPLFDEDAALPDAWFLDNAIAPAAASITSTGVMFYGLQHLNGQTASAWVAGLDCGDYQVANGSITVPFGAAGGYFTLAYLQLLQQAGLTPGPATVTAIPGSLQFPAVVGFTYTTQGQLLRPIAPQVTGAVNGPALGKTRRVHQFSALLNNCINGAISFGTSFTDMHVANLTSPSGVPYTPVQLVSGVHWDTIEDAGGFDGMICWQITRPAPATVCAIGGFLETQDR